jgi:GntR family transcriptional regulator
MLISVSEKDSRPIYLQIIAQVKVQIRDGLLSPGDELPSVRELADSLGVNLHTVHKAYQVLRDQGVIYLRLGQRAKVAELREAPASRDEVESVLVGRLNDLITEAFHLGLSTADFRALVEELLGAQRERGKAR